MRHCLGLLFSLFWLFLRQGLAFLVNLVTFGRLMMVGDWRKAVSFNIAAMMTYVVRGH